jgi:hypothetical protein
MITTMAARAAVDTGLVETAGIRVLTTIHTTLATVAWGARQFGWTSPIALDYFSFGADRRAAPSCCDVTEMERTELKQAENTGREHWERTRLQPTLLELY